MYLILLKRDTFHSGVFQPFYAKVIFVKVVWRSFQAQRSGMIDLRRANKLNVSKRENVYAGDKESRRDIFIVACVPC